jgi:RHS repeat-associated protein
MQLASGTHIPDGLLAANALLSEKLHRGFAAPKSTLHQGFGVAISSTALGIPGTLYDGRIGCRYTGKERDSESGLDYMDARYYGSTMGRFMSPDPILSSGHEEDPQTWNKYAYARNNPLRYTDPTGLDFSLGCSQNNGTTCQGGNTYYQDAKGNYQETLISSDAKGNLSDQSGNSYTANVSGSGVTFSGNGSSNVAGTFVNGTNATTINGSGALSGFTFNFTYSDMKSGVNAGGTFSFNGTPDQTESALGKAGFTHYFGDNFDPFHLSTKDYRAADYRSAGAAGTGAGSGHFTVHEPWVLIDNQVFMFKPSSPSSGTLHLGEYNPYSSGQTFENETKHLRVREPHLFLSVLGAARVASHPRFSEAHRSTLRRLGSNLGSCNRARAGCFRPQFPALGLGSTTACDELRHDPDLYRHLGAARTLSLTGSVWEARGGVGGHLRQSSHHRGKDDAATQRNEGDTSPPNGSCGATCGSRAGTCVE